MMMMMDDLEEGGMPVHRGTQMEEQAHPLDAVSPSPPHTTTTHQPTHRARSQGKDDEDDDEDDDEYYGDDCCFIKWTQSESPSGT